MPVKFANRKTPKVMFVNCGDGPTRRLDDCARLNFISAGQGKDEKPPRAPFYFSNQIRNLIVGDIITVYRNKVSYVGVARVISKPMTVSEAYLGGEKVTPDMFLGNMFKNADEPGYAECLVEIEWLTDVYLKKQQREYPYFGIFAKPLVVCSLDNQTILKQELEKAYGINFKDLLANHNAPRIEFIEENEEETFPEGKEKFILHKSKERNKELIRKAKELYYAKDNKLSCQICGFSFMEHYGDLGKGYIEAHHIYPISDLKEETETKIEDLAMLCSNCHRMVHRQPRLKIEDIKAIQKHS